MWASVQEAYDPMMWYITSYGMRSDMMCELQSSAVIKADQYAKILLHD